MFAGDAVAGYFGAMQEAELGKGFPGQRWPAAALPSHGSRAARTPHHPKSTAWCGTRSRWEAGGEQGGWRSSACGAAGGARLPWGWRQRQPWGLLLDRELRSSEMQHFGGFRGAGFWLEVVATGCGCWGACSPCGGEDAQDDEGELLVALPKHPQFQPAPSHLPKVHVRVSSQTQTWDLCLGNSRYNVK